MCGTSSKGETGQKSQLHDSLPSQGREPQSLVGRDLGGNTEGRRLRLHAHTHAHTASCLSIAVALNVNQKSAIEMEGLCLP